VPKQGAQKLLRFDAKVSDDTTSLVKTPEFEFWKKLHSKKQDLGHMTHMIRLMNHVIHVVNTEAAKERKLEQSEKCSIT
jgi:hypothetical protein